MPTTDFEIQEKLLRMSDADLQAESTIRDPAASSANDKLGLSVPMKKNSLKATKTVFPYQYVPLYMGKDGRSHHPSDATRFMLENEVSLEDVKHMTTKFYDFAFEDDTLDKFIRSHKDPHGDRFAKWIHQKLTGSQIWDDDRRIRDLTPSPIAGGRNTVVHDRSSAHVAAWHSVKRPTHEVGRHFTLAECRVWMRLHFWAMRETGLVERSPTFADYYVRFIGHFVAVYEHSATIFARESFRWSANPENVTTYIKNGRKMIDVIGVSYPTAIGDIPREELEQEGEWPYEVKT